MYKEKPGRVARIKEWESFVPAGSELGISESARLMQLTLPDGASRSGYGGQTVALVLCRHCGWLRRGNRLYKPRNGESAMPQVSLTDGVLSWIASAPRRGTLAGLRDNYNAWAAANGYQRASSWSIRPLIEANGYKVISRPRNVAVYAKDAASPGVL